MKINLSLAALAAAGIVTLTLASTASAGSLNHKVKLLPLGHAAVAGQTQFINPGVLVSLNPQPLPPGNSVMINPQPLPPRNWVMVNPQPLPPRVQ